MNGRGGGGDGRDEGINVCMYECKGMMLVVVWKPSIKIKGLIGKHSSEK